MTLNAGAGALIAATSAVVLTWKRGVDRQAGPVVVPSAR